MFDLNANTVRRTVTAALGAVLVSFAFVGAAVGPARAAENGTVANTAIVAISGQPLAG